MDELLKKLLSNEVLTEETKKELEGAFKQRIDEEITRARNDAKAEVTAELNEKWISERDTLIEALDAKVSEVLSDELKELREDIERFRDLEAEHAEKLVEAKSEMAGGLKKDMDALIEKLDKFLEVRLNKELTELREDIEEQRKKKFGQRVFEAFVDEFKKYYAADDSVEGKLNETESRLGDALEALEQSEQKVAQLERSKKMEEVLKPLSGRAKEVMEAVLKSVDTLMLEDAYTTYVGRVLKDVDTSVKATDTKKTSEKETPVLAEEEKKGDNKPSGIVKTGDDTQRLTEGDKLDREGGKISDEVRAKLRTLAGIK